MGLLLGRATFAPHMLGARPITTIGTHPLFRHLAQVEARHVGHVTALVAADHVATVITDHTVLVPLAALRVFFLRHILLVTLVLDRRPGGAFGDA